MVGPAMVLRDGAGAAPATTGRLGAGLRMLRLGLRVGLSVFDSDKTCGDILKVGGAARVPSSRWLLSS